MLRKHPPQSTKTYAICQKCLLLRSADRWSDVKPFDPIRKLSVFIDIELSDLTNSDWCSSKAEYLTYVLAGWSNVTNVRTRDQVKVMYKYHNYLAFALVFAGLK